MPSDAVTKWFAEQYKKDLYDMYMFWRRHGKKASTACLLAKMFMGIVVNNLIKRNFNGQ